MGNFRFEIRTFCLIIHFQFISFDNNDPMTVHRQSGQVGEKNYLGINQP